MCEHTSHFLLLFIVSEMLCLLHYMQESIDEGIEEDYEGVPPPGSWRSRHKPPGSPNTPVKHISTPLSSHNSHELTAESSGPLAEEDSETFLSPQTHWDREHSRYQQHQQELEKRKNLARAVHAAIKGAGCPEKNSPGHRHPSPAGVSASASDQRSPSLRPYAADCDSTPVEGSYSRLSASIDQLQQQLQQAVTDTRVVLSGTPGKAVRASSDNVDGFSCGSRQQQQQQLKHSSGAKSASAAAGRLESDVSELLCRTAGLLMPGSAPAAAGTTAVGLQILYADSPAGLRTVNAVQDTAVQGTSPHFNADGSTGHMGEGTQAAETSMNTTSACFAAASEAAATSSATAAEAEQSTDEAGNELQQRQQPTPGPAWEMEDYEEEFRQLQEQLQVWWCFAHAACTQAYVGTMFWSTAVVVTVFSEPVACKAICRSRWLALILLAAQVSSDISRICELPYWCTTHLCAV